MMARVTIIILEISDHFQANQVFAAEFAKN
jgi:hypothetical protein